MQLIALTGWGQDGDKQGSREAGCGHDFVKPPEPASLEMLLGKMQSADS